MSVRFSLGGLEDALSARLIGEDRTFTGIGIDTRAFEAGALYAAVRGERLDGHDFIPRAEAAGAVALLVERPVESDLPQLVVEDTVVALGRIAQRWLQQHPVPVVAITGSNGKTTTKEIVAAILGTLGPVLATRGNLNNDLGVPLTLFRLNAAHRYAVIEMGAARAGDIARLAAIAPPDVAVITSTGAAHLEGFGSLEGVANAKSELFDALKAHGEAVYNVDDGRVRILAERAAGHRQRTFGICAAAQVRGVPGPGLRFDALGQRHEPRFELLGDHNGLNALAAVAAVQCLDVQEKSIMAGLANVRPAPGRLQQRETAAGLCLIDDTYNANPVSMRAAIELLARRRGPRHLVIGDMLELGDQAVALHAEVGRQARRLGIDALWALGPLAAQAAAAFGNGAHRFEQPEPLCASLAKALGAGDTVLVKGSRGSRMERIVDALANAAPDAPTGAARRTAPAAGTFGAGAGAST